MDVEREKICFLKNGSHFDNNKVKKKHNEDEIAFEKIVETAPAQTLTSDKSRNEREGWDCFYILMTFFSS